MNSSNNWDQNKLEAIISQGIEESLTLEFKDGAALEKTETKKMEITKDVSALANSIGGTLIYGLSSFQEETKKHLAERISPINRREIPKEWLEQVIANIRPRISGIVVHPIKLINPEDVAYVVDVPQSVTAHQASDKRYYKRYNFESVPMEDYEIRLVMNRLTQPELEIHAIRCNFSALEDWFDTSHQYSQQAKFIEFNFQIYFENRSLVWADAMFYGFVGLVYARSQSVSDSLRQKFDIEAPEISSRLPGARINLFHQSNVEASRLIPPFESKHFQLGSYKIPFSLGQTFLPASWTSIIYLGAKDYEPKIYEVSMGIDQDLMKIAEDSQFLDGNENSLFQFVRISDRVPKISYRII